MAVYKKLAAEFVSYKDFSSKEIEILEQIVIGKDKKIAF